MNDSLIIQKLAELQTAQDTSIVHLAKIEQLINGIKSESIFLKLLPLIGVIIGGLITWFIQRSLKNKELNLQLLRDTKDTTNKILFALTSIHFHLRELAYLEVDSKYQYYGSQTEKIEDVRKRAYDEHYNDYKYISDVKAKISTCVAEINSNFTTYYKLKNLAVEQTLLDELDVFTNHILNLPREEEFDLTKEVTNDMLKLKISNLTSIYLQNIDNLIKRAKLL